MERQLGIGDDQPHFVPALFDTLLLRYPHKAFKYGAHSLKTKNNNTASTHAKITDRCDGFGLRLVDNFRWRRTEEMQPRNIQHTGDVTGILAALACIALSYYTRHDSSANAALVGRREVVDGKLMTLGLWQGKRRLRAANNEREVGTSVEVCLELGGIRAMRDE